MALLIFLATTLLAAAAASATASPRPAAVLRLVTFDLDDTLFPCGRVVQHANAALNTHLEALGAAPPTNFQDAIREVRTAHASAKGTALTYSELRRRAIAKVLREGCSALPPPAVVDDCFEVWLNARQQTADEMLFDGVVDAITRLRQQHPGCIIGAVTNGRGDPTGMPSLAALFDFCVSGEDEDVWPERKPSPAIYEHAIRRAASQPLASAGTCQQQALLRASWVHVGDCLVNDVEASKRAGASTVWLDMPSDPLATYSTASAEEEERRRVARANALAAGYVDVRIESMRDLPTALEQLSAGA